MTGNVPVVVIAEIGSVHDGSFGNACRLIELAAQCGADAVKFQTHIAEAESLVNAPSPSYFTGESRIEYFRRTGFSAEQWSRLAGVARQARVQFLSSPFSLEAVDLLESIGMSAYKIPSGEVSNIPLLERICRTGKPVLLSSGMSNWGELDAAVNVLRSGGAVTVMQCSSAYPCPDEQVGLNVITQIRQRYGLAVGYSDHTLGFGAAAAAVTLGATVVEKHFTYSRHMYGSDAKHSMEPGEFTLFCRELKSISRMLASPVDKDDLSQYLDMKRIFEKSLVTARPVQAGSVAALTHITFKKPGDGIRAAEYRRFLGRRFRRNLPADHKLTEADFE